MKVCTTCGTEWSDDTRFCPNDGTTLRSQQSADLVGSVIADRYHIEKKLGEGGMGAVYLGQHVKMGRKSAIKVMTQGMAHDPEAIARFNREAANAARITHPNVCAIYDFGETSDGIIYLAMEFIEGSSLSDLLKSEGALPPKRAAEILHQTAEALQAAHDLGIVHRDLKPDNIMLSRGRDGSDVVKVVDFGIAKAMGGEEGQKVTKTGLVVGTPEYMSPEQLSGDVLDGRSDIYSLALVFFRMLTGVLPFQADTAQETMIKRLTDDPLRLNEALPGTDFPQQLQHVMDHALQRMPADRYVSAAQFGRDVVEAVSGMAAPTLVDTEGATMLLDAGDVGATAQLVKTRVAGAKEPVTPATPAPMPSPRPPTKKKPVLAIAASIAVIAVGGVGAVIMLNADRGAAVQPAGNNDAPSAVTGDTASGSVGSNPGGRRTTPPTNDGQPRTSTDNPNTTNPGANNPPRGHSGAEIQLVNNEITGMIEQIFEDVTRPQAIRRAEQIYNDATWPDTVRASAASMAGSGYQFGSDLTSACAWINRAISLTPGNQNYRDLKSKWGCP